MLENHGRIFTASLNPSFDDAVSIGGDFATVRNLGTISATSAGGVAISVSSFANATIETFGTLLARVTAISGGDENDTVRNAGKIVGNVWLNDGNDLFDGAAGSVAGTVFGGDDGDVLRGGEADDTLLGDSGLDRLNGRAGDDSLDGGFGDDIVIGGLGDDELTGGSSADSFVFRRLHGDDTVTDFTNGFDRLDLSLGIESFSEVSARTRQKGADVFIDLTDFGGGTILLQDFARGDFNAADVLL